MQRTTHKQQHFANSILENIETFPICKRYSDENVFVCQMYGYTIGRTFNDKWVNMKNKELTDVILWAYIPEIPKDMHCLFD